MSKHGKRGIGYGGVAALLAVLTLCMFSAVGQDAAAPPPPAQEASDAGAVAASPPADATGALPEDEQYYRRGVELYKQDLYREALTEFNRALAINPNHEEARRFQEKANARLQESLAGVSGPAPAFETIDPDTIRKQGETIPPNADEVKRERIRNLLDTAARYMEAERFKVAVEIYSNVLLIDPNNPEAKEGLHKATLGARAQNVAEEEKGIQQDRAMIREYIEKSKRLPEGADATGIKPYRFSVPEIEEKTEQTKEKSVIETVLESPVSIEFEDIHLSEVVNFITDSWDINIVIDNRAVEPPAKAQPPQGGQPAGGVPGAPGMPGAFPGAPGAPGVPGAFPGAPGAFPAAGARPGAPGAAPAFGAQRPGAPAYGNQQPGTQGMTSASYDAVYGPKSSGIIPYINMKNVSLGEALKAMLRPLGLDYAVQPGFLWISKPEIIRRETFEKLETRYYELRNAGSETLYKLVLRNRFGGAGGRMGGYGGGMMGGGMGGYGGGMGGYGGGMGGYGGGMGGYGGGMGG
ncbi:MAG TPA: tetratricopeptide repeat protein, partial [Candidatus Hydrogenedentes bacterium]|nr:tetratricopeptide repeat protein [Candidatus Hydrogenedentota bacterium]